MLDENNKRLDYLYRNHNKWLRQVAWNIAKDEDIVDELISELYLYLGEKGNEKLYYHDGGFNLGYCTSFIKSRFYNKCKIANRYVTYEPQDELTGEAYDEDLDASLHTTYEDVKKFLKSKASTDDWASAKIAELYYFGSDFTIEGLAKEVGISKSTVFLHIKKMKQELTENIKNPFKNDN
jgi:DNA-directed RNA polymerase specialized sigma24 family protein